MAPDSCVSRLACVVAWLACVSKPSMRHVEDAGAEVGVDELGGQLEAVGQRRVRIGRLGLVVLADLLQAAAAGVGVGRGALHEVEQARRRRCRLAPRLRSSSRWSFLSAPLAAADLQLEVLQRRDRRHAHRGAGQGQRRALVVAGLRWNDGARRHALERLADPAFGQRRRPCWPACQMSIERKCDWLGLG